MVNILYYWLHYLISNYTLYIVNHSDEHNFQLNNDFLSLKKVIVVVQFLEPHIN